MVINVILEQFIFILFYMPCSLANILYEVALPAVRLLKILLLVFWESMYFVWILVLMDEVPHNCQVQSYFAVFIFQVWHIQPCNCLWSSGRNIFSTYFWKFDLLYFLIHKSEGLQLNLWFMNIRTFYYICNACLFCWQSCLNFKRVMWHHLRLILVHLAT